MNWIDKQLAKSGPKRSQNKQVDALKCDSSVYLVFLTKTTLSRQNYKKTTDLIIQQIFFLARDWSIYQQNCEISDQRVREKWRLSSI